MIKALLLPLVFFSCSMLAFAQDSNNKTLFVIDSIPLLTDPESWNQVTQNDIADITLITNKDSIKLLGWEQVDAITYIFTKAYRNRPDSIKQIPGLKQMISKDGLWYNNDALYSGRYIDYYNNGKIQAEGWLSNGILNGEVTTYFPNGSIKSVAGYKNAIRDGYWNDYYKNGSLMQTRHYTEGKIDSVSRMYFINGQLGHEFRAKQKTQYDTIISYYSTGEVRATVLKKPGNPYRSKKEDDLGYYITMYYKSMNEGDMKNANRHFYHIWLLDSTNIDTYFKEGFLLYKEFRYDQAIAAFDKALQKEPLMKESLIYRGLARIKKYKFLHTDPASKNNDIAVAPGDMASIPEEEQEKICIDLLIADEIDESDYFTHKYVPETILNYCREKHSR